MTPRVSVVVPAYDEGERITTWLDRVHEAVTLPYELAVVVDDPSDSTAPHVEKRAASDPRVKLLVNTYGGGPANAIRYGVERASAPVVVVTMSDGSDDPAQIDDLTRLVERGVTVAAASRYAPGGQQVGGPLLKRTLSRVAGRTLHLFARIGTRDATNSFKGYDREFVREVGIDSTEGFAVGLELTAKARRLRRSVAEIPTIWVDRTAGQSSFRVARWIPVYLRWYRFAFGPRLSPEDLRAKTAARRR